MIDGRAESLTLVVAISDAYGCLSLIQRIASGKGDERLRLQQIEVIAADMGASLRLRQEEICTPSS